jgi:hypothetical protein
MLIIKLAESPPIIHKMLALSILLPICGGFPSSSNSKPGAKPLCTQLL